MSYVGLGHFLGNAMRYFTYMGRNIVGFLKRFRGWIRIFLILLSSIVNIISNPSYIMFSLLAIGLGTIGIWIPLSPFDVGTAIEVEGFWSTLENISVFTFCVATLGNMATEYFFEEKDQDINIGNEIQNDDEYKRILSKHVAFFAWCLALLFSFLCLVDDSYLVYGISSTLSLWLLVNINRPKFRAINNAALKNLNPNLTTDGSAEYDEEFGGPGL